MICLLWLRLRRLLFCPDLLRFFNYIVRVSKIVAYLLRGEVHVDFSGSNVDNCFNGAEEQSSKDDGWIVLVFSHVNNLQPFGMSDLPSGAESSFLVWNGDLSQRSWLPWTAVTIFADSVHICLFLFLLLVPFLGSCQECSEICVVLFLKENVSSLPFM